MTELIKNSSAASIRQNGVLHADCSRPGRLSEIRNQHRAHQRRVQAESVFLRVSPSRYKLPRCSKAEHNDQLTLSIIHSVFPGLPQVCRISRPRTTISAVFTIGLHKFREAVALLEPALQIEPQNTMTRFELSYSLMHCKQYDAAIAQFEQSVALEPQPTRNFFSDNFTCSNATSNRHKTRTG